MAIESKDYVFCCLGCGFCGFNLSKDISRGHSDVKLNERASPKAAATSTNRPLSPLYNRLSGGGSLESPSSELHPLPLPPTSPTSPSAVHGSRIGGGYETSPLGFSKWKKGKFIGSGTFGQVYLGFNR